MIIVSNELRKVQATQTIPQGSLSPTGGRSKPGCQNNSALDRDLS